MSSNIKYLRTLIGKEVYQQNIKTKEYWQPRKLLQIVIDKDGTFAILDENYNVRVSLDKFYLTEVEP